MAKRILIVHPDLHVLAGDVRAILMFADMFKYLNYDVLVLYTDIRPHRDRYFPLHRIYDYHTVKYLEVGPCKSLGVRLCGNFQEIRHMHLRTQVYDYMIKLEEFDILFTDQTPLAFIGDDDAPVKVILYVHYPDRPRGPAKAKIWTNSSYIGYLVSIYWRRDYEVVHPPLHLEFYDPLKDYDDRYYDIVMFGQWYFLKGFNVAKYFADRGYKVAIVGAKVPEGKYMPPRHENIDMYPNATVREYARVLSNSKIYIHARPGEHFGITITEAMASGCAVVVHRSGGQWLDIVKSGRYGLGFSSFIELVKNVEHLMIRDVWTKYHKLSVKRSKAFSFEKIANKVKKLLSRM